MDLNTGVLISP